MSIKYHNQHNGTTNEQHVGRVMKLRSFVARRNMSDTLDYSDYEDVPCQEALVWLGTTNTDSLSQHFGKSLEPHEQFKWIDYSNHFGGRMTATVDSGPESSKNLTEWSTMWASFFLYEAWLVTDEARRAAEAQAQRDAKAALDAKIAKRDAEIIAKQRTDWERAEDALRPAKFARGCTVKLKGGVTGKIVWSGVKKFRNKINARLGVKEANGTVHWVNVSDVV